MLRVCVCVCACVHVGGGKKTNKQNHKTLNVSHKTLNVSHWKKKKKSPY